MPGEALSNFCPYLFLRLGAVAYAYHAQERQKARGLLKQNTCRREAFKLNAPGKQLERLARKSEKTVLSQLSS